jgi:hypothetical protein
MDVLYTAAVISVIFAFIAALADFIVTAFATLMAKKASQKKTL